MLRRTDNSNLIQSGNNNLTPTNKFTNNQIREYQELADKAIDLILFNKINSKNAFDVNNSFLEQLPMFLNQKEESSWQRISATLDASAKIYGYRVDSVHSEMFKFLGGLNRTEFHEDVEHNKKKKLDEPENVFII
jgi:condensin complex subunit 2